jgi:hypothetical protein
MATYAELAGIREESEWNSFMNKVRVACAEKATNVIDSTSPPASRLEWAKEAIADKNRAGDNIVDYVIMSNNGASIATILGAGDTAIQNNVNSAVDAIYT